MLWCLLCLSALVHSCWCIPGHERRYSPKEEIDLKKELLEMSAQRPPVEGQGLANWSYYSHEDAHKWGSFNCANMKKSWYSRYPVYTDSTGFVVDNMTWSGGRWPPVYKLRQPERKSSDVLELLKNAEFGALLDSLFNDTLPSESKRDIKEKVNAFLPSIGFERFSRTVSGAFSVHERHRELPMVIRMTLVDRKIPLEDSLACLSRVHNIDKALLFISVDKESREVFEHVVRHVDFMPVLLAWHPSDYASSPFSSTNSREMGRRINLHVMWQAAIVYDLIGAQYSINLEDDVCVGPDWHDFHAALGRYSTPAGGDRYSHILSMNMGHWQSCHLMHKFLANDTIGVDSLDLVSEELFFLAWGAGSGRARWAELYRSMQSSKPRYRWDMQLTHMLNGRPSLAPVVPRCYVLPNKAHDGHGTAFLHRFPMHGAPRHDNYRVVHYENATMPINDGILIFETE